MLGNLTFGGIISNSCKIIMPSLLGALKKSCNDLLAQNPSSQAVQPSHILLALKALSTGALEMNDTDFELLENYLKDSDKSKDSGKNFFRMLKSCINPVIIIFLIHQVQEFLKL